MRNKAGLKKSDQQQLLASDSSDIDSTVRSLKNFGTFEQNNSIEMLAPKPPYSPSSSSSVLLHSTAPKGRHHTELAFSDNFDDDEDDDDDGLGDEDDDEFEDDSFPSQVTSMYQADAARLGILPDNTDAFSDSHSNRLHGGGSLTHTTLTRDDDKISLAWRDLTVVTQPRNQSFAGKSWSAVKSVVLGKDYSVSEDALVSKTLLKGVSGVAQPGSVTAVMGPSGAGKSTLLNTLTGRLETNVRLIKGETRHNGINLNRIDASKIGAYVSQHDNFIGFLTVTEYLWFEARLRLTDPKVTDAQRRQRMQTVLHELGLARVAQSKIGVPGIMKTLSGGERKRLSFAAEILTNPGLLFADEPTSGLDSFMSYTVALTMRKLADRGKTIICTIHSPSSQTFNLFDTVIFLADGHIMYQGPLKQLDRFLSVLYKSPCSPDFNLADHALATISQPEVLMAKSAEAMENEGDSRTTASTWMARNFDKSEWGRTIKHRVEKSIGLTARRKRKSSTLAAKRLLEATTWTPANLATQTRCLFQRSAHTFYRTPAFISSRVFQVAMYTISFALMFAGQVYDQTGAYNLSSLLYQFQMMVIWDNLDAYSISIPLEIATIKADLQRGLYQDYIYLLSKTLVELPFMTCTILFQCGIVYWASNLVAGFWHWLVAMVTTITVAMVSVSLGYWLAFATPDIALQTMIKRTVLLPCVLTAGFYLIPDNMPAWSRWIQYLSFIHYAAVVLNLNQWLDVDFIACDPPDSPRCFPDGRGVLQYFGFDPDASAVANYFILLAFLVILRTIAWLQLRYRVKTNTLN